jgi:uncharacterized protein (DUF2384 family)
MKRPKPKVFKSHASLTREVDSQTRRLAFRLIRKRLLDQIRLSDQLKSIDLGVLARAIECFGSVESAANWLLVPAFGLGGRIPIKVAHTLKGRTEVTMLLGRIDYDVSL